MATKTEDKTSEDKLTIARNKNLELAIQQIAKDYGDGAIMRLGDEFGSWKAASPTGFAAFSFWTSSRALKTGHLLAWRSLSKRSR